MSEDDRKEDLLRRARELSEKADQAKRETDRSHTSAAERWLAGNKFFRKLADAGDTASGVLGPIGSFIGWLLRLIGRWLYWVAIQPPDADADGGPDEGGFSVARVIRNLAISAAAVIGLHVLWSAIYFYSTYFTETVYVTGKQEIVTGELYQFGGCTSLPCSTESDNGKFYLIESSLYFPVMFYPEEEVFANVPQQDAACNVEGYGIYFRTLRWIYKTLQLYQHVVDVSCRPYTEAETQRAVSEGEIVRDPPPEDQ